MTTQTEPTVLAIGKRLVELCEQDKNRQALDELYADNIVSIEVCGDETMPARMEGIDAIRGKTDWWYENHEVHGGSCSGPFPHGDQFIVVFAFEVTPKVGPMAGKRMKMEEAGIYTVKDGKISEERFFYDMSAMGG